MIATIERDGANVKARLAEVLKPKNNKDVAWPPAGLEKDLSDTQPGDRVLLFIRRDLKKGIHTLEHFILSQAKKVPGGADLPTGVGKDGKLPRSTGDLLKAVKARIALNRAVPRDCDRELAEQGDGGYGGFYAYPDSCELDDDENVFQIMMPPDPEFRRPFLLELSNPDMNLWDKALAARVLSNYNEPETIAALKKALADDWVFDQRWELPGGQVVYQNSFRWSARPKDLPAASAKLRVRRVYLVREAALESLQRLHVEVRPIPRLQPQ